MINKDEEMSLLMAEYFPEGFGGELESENDMSDELISLDDISDSVLTGSLCIVESKYLRRTQRVDDVIIARRMVEELLSRVELSDEKWQIISLYFGLDGVTGRQVKEVAEELNISRRNAGYHKKHALEKLRKAAKSIEPPKMIFIKRAERRMPNREQPRERILCPKKEPTAPRKDMQEQSLPKSNDLSYVHWLYDLPLLIRRVFSRFFRKVGHFFLSSKFIAS